MNTDKISQAYKNSVENYEGVQKGKHIGKLNMGILNNLDY